MVPLLEPMLEGQGGVEAGLLRPKSGYGEILYRARAGHQLQPQEPLQGNHLNLIRGIGPWQTEERGKDPKTEYSIQKLRRKAKKTFSLPHYYTALLQLSCDTTHTLLHYIHLLRYTTFHHHFVNFHLYFYKTYTTFDLGGELL